MKIYAVAHNQWEVLNKKGEHKSQADFAAALQQATGQKQSLLLAPHPKLKPLNDLDRQLHPLTAQDFGAAATANLRPLSSTDSVPGAKTTNDDTDSQLRRQAAKWVAETFYGTLLKQMQNDPFKSSLFDGGRGAQAFEPMFNQQIADHIGAGTSNRLVGAIVNEIESKMKRQQNQPPQQDTGSPMPPPSNPYWNERSYVAPDIRA
jgi:Rod binding domain-containing protein